MIKSFRILEKRNGEKVLQMLDVDIDVEGCDLGLWISEKRDEWIDVPLVKEGEDE